MPLYCRFNGQRLRTVAAVIKKRIAVDIEYHIFPFLRRIYGRDIIQSRFVRDLVEKDHIIISDKAFSFSSFITKMSSSVMRRPVAML